MSRSAQPEIGVRADVRTVFGRPDIAQSMSAEMSARNLDSRSAGYESADIRPFEVSAPFPKLRTLLGTPRRGPKCPQGVRGKFNLHSPPTDQWQLSVCAPAAWGAPAIRFALSSRAPLPRLMNCPGSRRYITRAGTARGLGSPTLPLTHFENASALPRRCLTQR